MPVPTSGYSKPPEIKVFSIDLDR
ncbi:protein of unknown function (plasmid) [Caballeronia sp. S22]